MCNDISITPFMFGLMALGIDFVEYEGTGEIYIGEIFEEGLGPKQIKYHHCPEGYRISRILENTTDIQHISNDHIKNNTPRWEDFPMLSFLKNSREVSVNYPRFKDRRACMKDRTSPC